jgi:hypothetical protein
MNEIDLVRKMKAADLGGGSSGRRPWRNLDK